MLSSKSLRTCLHMFSVVAMNIHCLHLNLNVQRKKHTTTLSGKTTWLIIEKDWKAKNETATTDQWLRQFDMAFDVDLLILIVDWTFICLSNSSFRWFFSNGFFQDFQTISQFFLLHWRRQLSKCIFDWQRKISNGSWTNPFYVSCRGSFFHQSFSYQAFNYNYVLIWLEIGITE